MEWKKLSEENKPESKRDYLVALDTGMEDDGKPVVSYHLLTWLNEGDVVKLTKKASDIGKSNMTASERLLNSIFGSSKDFRIKRDGFYMITSDFNWDNMENTDCENDAIFFGDTDFDIWYAEYPAAPEGCATEYEFDLHEEEKRQKARQEAIDAEKKIISENAKENGPIDERVAYFSHIEEKKIVPDWRNALIAQNEGEKEILAFRGMRYKNCLDDIVLSRMFTFQLIDVLQVLFDGYSKEMIRNTCEDIPNCPDSLRDLFEVIDEICDAYDTFGIMGTHLRRVFKTTVVNIAMGIALPVAPQHALPKNMQLMAREPYFVEQHRDIYGRYAACRSLYNMRFCAERILNLKKLEAPAIIVSNEERLLWERTFVYLTNPVEKNWDFEVVYDMEHGVCSRHDDCMDDDEDDEEYDYDDDDLCCEDCCDDCEYAGECEYECDYDCDYCGLNCDYNDEDDDEDEDEDIFGSDDDDDECFTCDGCASNGSCEERNNNQKG